MPKKHRIIGLLGLIYTIALSLHYYKQIEHPWGPNTPPFILLLTYADIIRLFFLPKLFFGTGIIINIGTYTLLFLLCLYLIINLKYAAKVFMLFLAIVTVFSLLNMLLLTGLPASHGYTQTYNPVLYRSYGFFAFIIISCLASVYALNNENSGK